VNQPGLDLGRLWESRKLFTGKHLSVRRQATGLCVGEHIVVITQARPHDFADLTNDADFSGRAFVPVLNVAFCQGGRVMRAFVAFLFVAAGMAIATSMSSAQGFVPPHEQIEADPSAAGGPTGPCFGPGGGLFGRCGGCGGCCSGGDDVPCACHGSYKYPVPPQYTYFWPGIYGQRTMTQYVSPWRYPDLNPSPEAWKVDPSEDKSPYSGYRY
jgi:hypothetical protein